MKNLMVRELRKRNIKASIETKVGGLVLLRLFKNGKIIKFWLRETETEITAPMPDGIKNNDVGFIFAHIDDSKDFRNATYMIGDKNTLRSLEKDGKVNVRESQMSWGFDKLADYLAG